MAVTFSIFPERGLVYVRYEGEARLADTMAAFAEYAAHPDCRPGQKQLVDLSAVTGVEMNFAQLMEMQARKADLFGTAEETLMVYFAPTPEARRIANLAMRSWQGLGKVVALVAETEKQALELLGLSETGIAELTAQAG
ncbi:hypothetical protein SAMN05216257_103225 [Meinhardsimonia xiamenensis]|jgi:hypothetical protein|uniref:Uncharacterized protein n=1 Tax=Meinhardsimonia xiamenensis TaxID=990712 RepID=A0A1G9CTJ1_9RHOB|nr:hypothetical protein [Meinhardsimonia xiamenensis]PRX38249.1 hypothetical protein LV81_00529 [Meinhardsimonia xiamenensis]SDK55000.1 hypothetical protein SAMN05216257_103225 [Meinhardsimonia xiamenensis]